MGPEEGGGVRRQVRLRIRKEETVNTMEGHGGEREWGERERERERERDA
jgi:hypothetical protein